MSMRMPGRCHRMVLGIVALAALPGTARAAESDPKAAAVAARVMEALGGSEAWNKTRYLRFDWGVERDGKMQTRSHTWDKWTGRYRLEGVNPQGDPYVVLMNLNTKDGQAWVKGQPQQGEA